MSQSVGWRLGKNGQIHRKRLIQYPNGDMYDGEVVDGKRDGHGTLKTSKFTYVGPFECGLIDGINGVMIWNTFKENGVEVIGKKYEGSFKKGKKEGYGVLVDGKGYKYEGMWQSDKFNGKGKLTKSDGIELHEGVFVDGKLHCDQGKIRFQNGDVYEGAVHFGSPHSTVAHITYGYGNSSYSGQFHYGLKHGIGTRNYIDGSTYRGYFHQNRIHGHGTMQFSDNNKTFKKYVGEWEDGIFHGEGELYYNNESDVEYFKGGFMKGLYHGKGKLQYRDGGYYDGDFSALMKPLVSCKHGQGTRVWASGNKFEGTWQKDLMVDGRYFDHQHSSTYVGSFVDDRKSGTEGREVWHSPNGEAYYDPCLKWKHKGNETCRYSGGYKLGYFHGRGKFSSQDGRSYDGEWKLGKQHGYGIAMLLSNYKKGNPDKMFIGRHGSLYKPIIYEGEWNEGCWHGKGKLIYPDGTIKVGTFTGGHMVE